MPAIRLRKPTPADLRAASRAAGRSDRVRLRTRSRTRWPPPRRPRTPPWAVPSERICSTAELYEDAIRHGEGLVAAEGPLVVRTGKHTGRSPDDKFIVDEPTSRDKIWWGPVNRPISETHYDRLRARLVEYVAIEGPLHPGLLHRRGHRPSPVAAGLHRDRLGEHLRAQPVPPAARRCSWRASRRTSRSSASRRSRPTRPPRARGPGRPS